MIYSENLLLCIAIPMLISLVFLRGTARPFTLSFVTGMVICLMAAYISGFVLVVTGASEADVAVVFSPVIEECMKLLPLLFCLYVIETSEEETFMFSLSIGVGFATFENCCYLLSAGTESLRFTMVRGLAVGVMHVVSMVALAMCVLMTRRYQVPSLAGTIGALSMSCTFHALYNLLVSEPGLSSYVGYALPLVTATLLYLPYRRLGPRAV